MRKFVFFLLMLACGMQLSAQSAEQTEEQPQTEADTLVCRHPMPQHLQASMPRRAAEASACPVDSIAGYDDKGNVTSTTLYEYDAAGNTIAETKYQWNDGVRTGISRYWKHYIGSTAVTTVNYQWDAVSKAWTGRDSTELLYDGSLNIGSVSYVWENGAWRPQTLYEYEYNASGKRTLSCYSKWSAADNALQFVEKYEWFFDAAGNQTQASYWLYKNGHWEGKTNTIAAYDANKNKILEEKYSGWENNDWKGTTKNIYVYNSSKQLTEQTAYTWKNGWVEKTKVTKEYSGSNVIDNAYYSWENGAWVGTSRTSKTYSGKQVQTETAWAWNPDAAEWEYAVLTEYTYTGSKILTCTKSDRRGDSWVYVSKLENSYDASGRIEKETTFARHGDMWTDSIYTAYEYSPKGVNTLKVSLKKEGDLWMATDSMKHEVTYTTINGKELTLSDLETQWTASTGRWVGKSKSESHYDEAGNLILAETFNFIGNVWVYNTRRQYAYKNNNSSLCTLELSMTWDNNKQQWSGKSKYEYDFDDLGRKYIAATYKWNSSHVEWEGVSKSEDVYEGTVKTAMYVYKWNFAEWNWTGMFRYGYTYDDSGRVTEQIVSNYDAATDSYNIDLKYKYWFDSKGRQVRSETYAWMEEIDDWCIKSREEVGYDDDSNSKTRYQLNATWSNCELSSYDKKQYYYACDPKYYTVVFADWDGKELQSDKLLEGTKPEYKGENPERKADAQYTYKFAGWDKELAAVAGNITYTATYSTTLNKYTVTFYDEDGVKELQKGELEYGKMPVYEGEDPVKTGDAQYTYTFAGWDKEIVAVTGEASYKATYTQTVNKYTVTFYDEDGVTVLDTKEWEYGKIPACTEPVKEADAQYTYTFAGWDNEIVAVTGTASYKATYSTTTNKYTVTFYDEGGEKVLDTKEWEYGKTPACTEPVKEADAQYTYTFAGWDNEIVAVTGEASYKATYTPAANKYLVTFYDEDGITILYSKEVEYGVTPVYEGEAPVKTADAQYTYTFAGWDNEIVAVTGEASYKATYSTTTNKYTVTFYDEDGEKVLDTKEVEYGVTPVYEGEAPVKTADAQYTYTFAGWDNEIVAVTGEASYKATYSTTTNKYTVTFYDEDGEKVLDTKEVEYGVTPVYEGEAPVKTADAQYTYTFAGWDNEIVAVTGTASYKATYSTTTNKYTVTFYDEGGEKILWTEVLEYGVTPEYKGEKPMKEGNQQYSYSFMGWDNDIVPVTGDAVYTAVFMQNINKFTVTFRDADGVTELQSKNYEYGEVPVYEGEAPTKTGDAQYSYVFNGWDKEIVAVTEYTVYTAQYKEEVNKYLITFYDEDGITVLWSSAFAYGTTPVYGGETPATTGDAQYSHMFKGWDKALAEVTGEASYKAQYEDVLNKYTVTFYDEDGETVLDSREWEYGDIPSYMGESPTKAEDDNYTYTFAGWSEIKVVTDNASYTASYTAIPKTPTALGGMQETEQRAVKVVENGVLYIILDGVKYDASGNNVR